MDVITSLKLIRQNMDEIPVMGIRNQDRLVGCAGLLDKVIAAIEEAVTESDAEKASEKEQTVENG